MHVRLLRIVEGRKGGKYNDQCDGRYCGITTPYPYPVTPSRYAVNA